MQPLLAYILRWFVSGYLITALVSRYVELPFNPIQLGLFGLLIGLIGLAIVTRTERGRRMFYEGPGPDEDGDPLIGCLWMITGYVAVIAILGWMINLIL
jgi:hypothetical protein